MKQNLLKTFMALFLLMGASAITVAQTIYGARSSWDGVYMESFNLADVNAGATVTATTLQTENTVFYDEFRCGTTVGNKYYAIFVNEDYEPCLGTLNFETGKVVVAAKLSESANTNFADLTSCDGKLYGLRSDFNANDEFVTEIVEIDVETGELFTIASFTGYSTSSSDAFSSDGKGGFYWVHNDYAANLYPTLLHVDGDRKLTTVFKDETAEIPNNESKSLVTLEDGTLVYTASTSVFVINPAEKTIALKGTLAKALKGLTTTLANEDASGSTGGGDEEKPKNMRKLVRTTMYGDYMGTTTDATKQYNYFYDGKLNTLRMIEMGRDNSLNAFSPNYYTKYNYDETGRLNSMEVLQYGLYDLGDVATKESQKHNYTYNEQGKLVKDEWTYSGNPYRTTTYEYDEDGNLASEIYVNNGKEYKTEYFEYDEFGNATNIAVTTPWENTLTIRQYDENGNITGAQKLDTKVDEEFGTPSMTPLQFEEWTYDETGFMTAYVKYGVDETTGDPVPSVKTVYEAVDGNPNLVKHQDYTYFAGEWYGSGSMYYIDEYADFADMVEATSTELTVADVEDKMNTAKLTFRLPDIAMVNGCMVDVYRDGQKIYTGNPIKEFEFAQNDEGVFFLNYTDEFVVNGTHDYFVQAGVAAYSDDMEAEPAYTYYCTSNAVNKEFNTELPAVTGLNVTGAKKEKVKDIMTGASYDVVVASLAWTNPADADKYGFISNSVYAQNMSSAENTTEDIEAASLDVQVPYTMTVYVCTRYKLGKAKSETIVLNLKELENISTGIKTVSADGIGMQLNGKVLNIDSNANVSVFTVGGKLAVKADNATSVDMSNLTNGVYVITVEKGGKLNSYKVVLK